MLKLEKYQRPIADLCRKHSVKTLYAFGSVLTSRFSEKSDVDLLVNFQELSLEKYAENYFDLKFSLQDLFERPVDLLEEKAVRNPFVKKQIESEMQLLYGNGKSVAM